MSAVVRFDIGSYTVRYDTISVFLLPTIVCLLWEQKYELVMENIVIRTLHSIFVSHMTLRDGINIKHKPCLLFCGMVEQKVHNNHRSSSPNTITRSVPEHYPLQTKPTAHRNCNNNNNNQVPPPPSHPLFQLNKQTSHPPPQNPLQILPPLPPNPHLILPPRQNPIQKPLMPLQQTLPRSPLTHPQQPHLIIAHRPLQLQLRLHPALPRPRQHTDNLPVDLKTIQQMR